MSTHIGLIQVGMMLTAALECSIVEVTTEAQLAMATYPF
jgi:hypothetical protein